MKKLMTIVFALSLLTAFTLVAQDTTKQDTMKSDTSMKAASIMGKISDDGKTFVSGGIRRMTQNDIPPPSAPASTNDAKSSKP